MWSDVNMLCGVGWGVNMVRIDDGQDVNKVGWGVNGVLMNKIWRGVNRV